MLNDASRVIVSNSAAVNRCIEPVTLLVVWAAFTFPPPKISPRLDMANPATIPIKAKTIRISTKVNPRTLDVRLLIVLQQLSFEHYRLSKKPLASPLN